MRLTRSLIIDICFFDLSVFEAAYPIDSEGEVVVDLGLSMDFALQSSRLMFTQADSAMHV